VLANREFTAVKERVLLMEEPDDGAVLVQCVFFSSFSSPIALT
jgi:hypothetical protein